MGLVDNVKKVAKRKNMTIMKLENLAGLPTNAIYKWDKNDPGVRKVAKAADVLGTTVDELIR